VSPSGILSVVLAAALVPAAASAQPSSAPVSAQTAAEAQDLAHYQRLAEDLKVTIAQTEVMRRQIDDLQQRIGLHRAAVGRVAAATYRGHRVHPLYMLAGADSRGDAMRRLLLVSGFAERQQQEIDELVLTRARYEATQRTLESLIAQQRSQQQALAALRRKPGQ
jgi:septal ring factor EnvC (AmiA/AmiB activator)